MEFFVRAAGKAARLAILSGTFHPPTRAHGALARAGLAFSDEVLFVLPRELPHKRYEWVGFERRLAMLKALAAGESRFSVGSTDGGLFLEIAREVREAYGADTRLAFLCGRDAAERIVNWDYGRPGVNRAMLEEFELLVASRGGEYVPPPELRNRIHPVVLEADFDSVSASEVRRRIQIGEAWEHMVPEKIVPLVREYYAGGPTGLPRTS
jgi:nicotinic acid mononucleotide adenylyltransferase